VMRKISRAPVLAQSNAPVRRVTEALMIGSMTPDTDPLISCCRHLSVDKTLSSPLACKCQINTNIARELS
jgi:hypothetical protein